MRSVTDDVRAVWRACDGGTAEAVGDGEGGAGKELARRRSSGGAEAHRQRPPFIPQCVYQPGE
jgi:hypothetical protein